MSESVLLELKEIGAGGPSGRMMLLDCNVVSEVRYFGEAVLLEWALNSQLYPDIS